MILLAPQPEAIAAFREREVERHDVGGRCEACLGELESVLAHEGMQLLQLTADVEPLAPGVYKTAAQKKQEEGDCTRNAPLQLDSQGCR